MIALDPLLGISTDVTTQLRRMGLLPKQGITTSFGGNVADLQRRPVVNPELNRPNFSGMSDREQRFAQYQLMGNPPAAISPPAQRAEAQERSRVAQMTEQDPLFKKYQVADLTKAYNAAATPEEKERIGLQIWSTTNPELAKRVRPGQVGYQTSAEMRGSQVFGKDIPGITEAQYQQSSQAAGLPSNVPFTPGAMPVASAFGLGADAQQLGVSAPGTIPPTMIGQNVFQKGFDVPSSENLTQTQRALLKRAFEGLIK